MPLKQRFGNFARSCAVALGSPTAFVVNCALILLWLCSGPLFAYSDTWQLLVNTATTIFTYLAVFLLQNSQNRDSKALHLKIDELIRATERARNSLVDLENLTDDEMAALERQFQKLKNKAAPRAR